MGQNQRFLSKKFDSKPVNNYKLIKSKINFDSALPEGKYYSYFSDILLEYLSGNNKNHTQIFSKHVKLCNKQGKQQAQPEASTYLCQDKVDSK